MQEYEFQEILSDFNIKEVEKFFAGKTILLPGGSGFLGSNFKSFFLKCNRYLKNPIKVISIDNYIKGVTSASEESPDNNLISIELNLCNGLESLNYSKIDYIINCSGNASPSTYSKYPIETMDVSTLAIRHLFDLAVQHKSTILNFSSSEVLGTPQDKDIPTGEDVTPTIHPFNPRAPYDVTKLYIETATWVFKKQYGLNAFVIRPFNVIGSNMRRNDYRVIPNFLDKLLSRQKVQIYAPGTQTRTFCYFTDFIVGALKVICYGKALLYHIGNPNNEISMIDLAKMLSRKISEKDDLISIVECPETYKYEPKRRCPSVKLAQKDVGYYPKVKINDMINRVYDFAVKNWN